LLLSAVDEAVEEGSGGDDGSGGVDGAAVTEFEAGDYSERWRIEMQVLRLRSAPLRMTLFPRCFYDEVYHFGLLDE
jgi:hypothetical protein